MRVGAGARVLGERRSVIWSRLMLIVRWVIGWLLLLVGGVLIVRWERRGGLNGSEGV